MSIRSEISELMDKVQELFDRAEAVDFDSIVDQAVEEVNERVDAYQTYADERIDAAQARATEIAEEAKREAAEAKAKVEEYELKFQKAREQHGV